jgi:aryl-alcohol dehydrogenase-like predicted oxidoreductase
MGLGCMKMTNAYGTPERSENLATIHAALDEGVTYLNAADYYGGGDVEMVIGEAIRGRKRDNVYLAVKFGALVSPDGKMYGIDVRPQTVKNFLTYSLKRLGLDYIDLYQPGRANPYIPIEETIGAVADLVKEGYVRHIGVSEVDTETLRRANATHHITLAEMNYSMVNRSIEREFLPMARKLGVGIAAFGSLSMGFLSDTPPKLPGMGGFTAQIASSAFSFTQELRAIAEEKGISLSCLAIAWVLAQGEDIVVVVGSRRVLQFRDNLKALDVHLTAEDLDRINLLLPKPGAIPAFMPKMKIDKDGYIRW